MRHRFHTPLLLAALLLLVLGLSACGSAITPGEPALPPGFEDAELPDVPVGAYVYLHPSQPASIGTTRLTDTQDLLPGDEVPKEASVSTLRVWAPASVSSYGAALDLASEPEARMIARLREAQGGSGGAWHERRQREVLLGRGDGEWTDRLRRALNTDRVVPIDDAVPEAWETIRLLPADAPAPVVAAGFLRMNERPLETLATKAGIETRGIGTAVGFIQVDTLAFAAYAEQPVEVNQQIGTDLLARAEAGVVFVGRSSYPGPLLSLAFNLIQGRTALEETGLPGGASGYRLAMQRLHLMVGHRGNVVVAALAATEERAKDLLVSAMRLER